VNGQSALDMSFQIKATSTRRIGIDYEEGQFVIFDQTSEGVFHGHVRSWAQLDQVQRNVLIRLDLVDRRGNILVGPQ
jgi:filamentous hemagglutinin